MSVDTHIHTYLCGHADGRPSEYVRVAGRKGIQTLTFACHMPLSLPGFGLADVRMDAGQFADYLHLVDVARVTGRQEGVEVLCGIEAEIFPDDAVMEEVAAFLARWPFDYVIGSLHTSLPAYENWLEENRIVTRAQFVDAYFEGLVEGAESGLYDAIGHPTHPFRRASHYGTIGSLEFGDTIRRFITALSLRGVCYEINTTGLECLRYETMHDQSIVKWAVEAGVEFTVGSDAHTPSKVGQHYNAVHVFMTGIGVGRTRVFRHRSPTYAATCGYPH